MEVKISASLSAELRFDLALLFLTIVNGNQCLGCFLRSAQKMFC
jgi:hypothetical protein